MDMSSSSSSSSSDSSSSGAPSTEGAHLLQIATSLNEPLRRKKLSASVNASRWKPHHLAVLRVERAPSGNETKFSLTALPTPCRRSRPAHLRPVPVDSGASGEPIGVLPQAKTTSLRPCVLHNASHSLSLTLHAPSPPCLLGAPLSLPKFSENTHASAWAFCVIGLVDSEWQWFGFLSDSLPAQLATGASGKISAHVTEQWALLHAIAFAASHGLPTFIGFDCMSAAGQAEGYFSSKPLSHLQCACISLLRVCSALHISLQLHHVRSHQGHAGNDFVDAAAKAAASPSGHRAPPKNQFLIELWRSGNSLPPLTVNGKLAELVGASQPPTFTPLDFLPPRSQPRSAAILALPARETMDNWAAKSGFTPLFHLPLAPLPWQAGDLKPSVSCTQTRVLYLSLVSLAPKSMQFCRHMRPQQLPVKRSCKLGGAISFPLLERFPPMPCFYAALMQTLTSKSTRATLPPMMPLVFQAACFVNSRRHSNLPVRLWWTLLALLLSFGPALTANLRVLTTCYFQLKWGTIWKHAEPYRSSRTCAQVTTSH